MTFYASQRPMSEVQDTTEQEVVADENVSIDEENDLDSL